MKYITKLKLAAIHQLCDADDRSTEFMIAYMMDVCKVSHDTVMNYLLLDHKEHKRLCREVNDFCKMFNAFDEQELLD